MHPEQNTERLRINPLLYAMSLAKGNRFLVFCKRISAGKCFENLELISTRHTQRLIVSNFERTSTCSVDLLLRRSARHARVIATSLDRVPCACAGSVQSFLPRPLLLASFATGERFVGVSSEVRSARKSCVLITFCSFLFADYHRLSSVGGEQALAKFVTTLFQAAEKHYGWLSVRLYCAFRPKFGILPLTRHLYI